MQKAEICFCLSRHKRDVEEKDLKLKMIASNKSNFFVSELFISHREMLNGYEINFDSKNRTVL